MGAGRNPWEAHDEIVALVKGIAGAGYYTALTGVYPNLILPEEGVAAPPYACVDIEDLSLVGDWDTTMQLVMTETIYIFVPETASVRAKSSTVTKQLLQALGDLMKTMLANADAWNTLNGKAEYVKPLVPKLIPAYGMKYGELQFQIAVGLDCDLGGLGPV